jgi:hypothetical protein
LRCANRLKAFGLTIAALRHKRSSDDEIPLRHCADAVSDTDSVSGYARGFFAVFEKEFEVAIRRLCATSDIQNTDFAGRNRD